VVYRLGPEGVFGIDYEYLALRFPQGVVEATVVHSPGHPVLAGSRAPGPPA
jgi:hypothetical protein